MDSYFDLQVVQHKMFASLARYGPNFTKSAEISTSEIPNWCVDWKMLGCRKFTSLLTFFGNQSALATFVFILDMMTTVFWSSTIVEGFLSQFLT